LGFDHRVGHVWRLSSMVQSAHASCCGDEEGKSGTSRGGARAPCSAPSAMALAGRQSLRASLQAQAAVQRFAAESRLAAASRQLGAPGVRSRRHRGKGKVSGTVSPGAQTLR